MADSDPVSRLASRRLAPTSFTRKPALQTVGGGRSSIRSTTGNNLPPSIYLRQSGPRPETIFLASGSSIDWTACATADLSSSADYDDVTDYIIIDGPLRCSSWFPFDVPAGPSSSSSACSWFLSFQLVHYAPAGSTWPPPDYEQLTQLWTSPFLIQLPFTMINQTSC
ncbi:hypothetical protein F511_22419 [Dorcoceras hygrometricum]|uniref:Uncharacterized protein n=1 Tax=Dorcoceras hygrometricum TaxID=472368 RepID=A0A2Z7DF92_9LAMI|nr:hypothetical protein F511_22419 [Dorcoceras hygrometricum]